MTMTLKELQRRYIVKIIQKNGGNKKAAARDLGVSLKTIYNKLNYKAAP